MSQSLDGLPDFDKTGGMVPVVVQDVHSDEVLMLAYMNAEAYAETLATSRAVYFSRSRNRLWCKGEHSGHVQRVCGVYLDCDGDTILLRVEQCGAACHDGYRSCFYRQVTPEGPIIVAEKVFNPEEVYGEEE